MSPRAISAALMGYSSTQKGYKLYDLHARSFLDFVTTKKSNCAYPLSSYVYYEHLTPSYKAALNSYSSIVEPYSYKEAATDPKWIEAIKLEIAALEENNTWSIVDLPKGKTPIGCKWVFKIKYKSSGGVERYKERLVAKDYNQQEGLDYKETFSPIAKMVIVRSVVIVSASRY
ncbi:uncharacterized mitochondrial protein AtMg00820-like [Nicotiana tomentosiformis]|uniref:uncharacterized mitochondrial protein AtMg00820-like n=1 Tax=Nicotiana tomentosiformis TaxID=4098 RepID=UPI00388CADBC